MTGKNTENTKKRSIMGKYNKRVKKSFYTHTIVIEIADGEIQLCVVSQFPATDDVHLLGREESTDTLGANFIRSKGRYFFTAVLLFRARFYNVLRPTQICILKRDSHCSGENFTKLG